MTENPLRLVVDHGDDTAPAAIELHPASGAALHIHLHTTPQDARLSFWPGVLAPDGQQKGQSGKRASRPVLLGTAGVLVAVVAFVFGARSAGSHLEPLAAAKTSAAGLTSLAPLPSEPQASGTLRELPASIQQQLAQQPTVTPPPGAATAAGGTDPFGLQH